MATPEERLCHLAREFRGDKDEEKRKLVAAAYETVVNELIASGTWVEIPPFEDMLPDEYMPETFFTYWK